MGGTSRTSTVITVTVPPHRIDQAARDITRRGIGPFAGLIGAYYLFMTGFHVVFGPPETWWVLSLACGLTALFLGALSGLFSVTMPPRKQVYAWVVLVTSLVLLNITLFQIVSGDVRNLVNFALVNVIAGVLVLSRPLLLSILLVDTACWMLAERVNGMGDPAFDGGFLAGTWLLALGLSWIQVESLGRAEAHRLQAEIALDRAERRLEQRDRAIRAHKRSQAGLRRLIEMSQQCVVIVQGGVVVYVNTAFRELMGMRPQALLGRTIQDLVHPDDVDLADIQLLEQESGLGVELRFVLGSGDTLPLDVTASTMEYGDGPATLLIGIDERSLDTPDRQALANRMLAVGTLAAGVAHEINNPLAYTIANLEVLQIELSERGFEQESLVSVALEGAGRVRDIVADLRRFSRQEEATLAPVDVVEVLEGAIRMAWNEIRHRAQLVRDFEDVPLVVANGSRMGQVFLNLLVNAAQAIPDGDSATEQITVRTRSQEGQVVIEFEDTGSGIPPAIRDQIFQPFFTTKPLGVGTGLGLPYCRNVVDELHGTLEVESDVGKGSRFTVRLPACEAGEAAIPASPPAGGPHAGSPRSILLIDDETALAEAIAAVFSGDDVVVAGSGPEALELLDRNWDAILCDVMMPEMSGPEVYRRIVEARPDLAGRIAFVTGGSFTESTRDFLENTAAPILAKPFRAAAIRALVDQLASV